MRILQLNVWTGRIKGALLDFLRNNDFFLIYDSTLIVMYALIYF